MGRFGSHIRRGVVPNTETCEDLGRATLVWGVVDWGRCGIGCILGASTKATIRIWDSLEQLLVHCAYHLRRCLYSITADKATCSMSDLGCLLLYLEIIRSSMILKGTEKDGYNPVFSDIVVLLLLAVLAFYGTGHQATLATLQLKSAFLVHPTVVYPYSRITLVLNLLGSFLFVGFAAPLLSLRTSDRVPERKIQYFGASIQLTRYCSVILCACMADVILFTSHPLVWRVVAPRYVLGVMVLVIVDLTTGVACALLHWTAGRII